jgi:hypothetical protein
VIWLALPRKQLSRFSDIAFRAEGLKIFFDGLAAVCPCENVIDALMSRLTAHHRIQPDCTAGKPVGDIVDPLRRPFKTEIEQPLLPSCVRAGFRMNKAIALQRDEVKEIVGGVLPFLRIKRAWQCIRDALELLCDRPSHCRLRRFESTNDIAGLALLNTVYRVPLTNCKAV